jgi:DNA-binding transcriptional regulator YhcF (GntR family)
MGVRINKDSEVSICKQISEQIVFLISTGRLKADDALPSVRQMALRAHRHPHRIGRPI